MIKISEEIQKYRLCSKCKKEFPLTNEYFHKDKSTRTGFRSSCKECEQKYRNSRKDQIKEYRETHKEEIKKQRREFYKNNKDKCLEKARVYRSNNKESVLKRRKEYYQENKEQIEIGRIKYKYDIDIDTYNSLLQLQNNKCAICGNELKTGKGGKAIDHCHGSKKVRGILCTQCNTAMGLLKENINTLQSMITYLEIN